MRAGRLTEESGNRQIDAVMDPAPSTWRPSASVDETRDWMREHHVDLALVTTSDGALLGTVPLSAVVPR